VDIAVILSSAKDLERFLDKLGMTKKRLGMTAFFSE
jgi:hypothetical protein